MSVYLRLDEGAGVIWIGGESDEVWETVQAVSRLGVGVQVESMGSRTSTRGGVSYTKEKQSKSVGEIWSIKVDRWDLAREFFELMTSPELT